jgi:hypothetical protein
VCPSKPPTGYWCWLRSRELLTKALAQPCAGRACEGRPGGRDRCCSWQGGSGRHCCPAAGWMCRGGGCGGWRAARRNHSRCVFCCGAEWACGVRGLLGAAWERGGPRGVGHQIKDEMMCALPAARSAARERAERAERSGPAGRAGDGSGHGGGRECGGGRGRGGDCGDRSSRYGGGGGRRCRGPRTPAAPSGGRCRRGRPACAPLDPPAP